MMFTYVFGETLKIEVASGKEHKSEVERHGYYKNERSWDTVKEGKNLDLNIALKRGIGKTLQEPIRVEFRTRLSSRLFRACLRGASPCRGS